MPEPGKRTFTFEEARKLLPEVKKKTRAAVEKVEEIESSIPDDEDPDEARERVSEETNAVLHAWAQEILAMGVEVKGPWLVDFDSGGGYYCWKWPEERLEFFHSYEEGFAGRVRLQ